MKSLPFTPRHTDTIMRGLRDGYKAILYRQRNGHWRYIVYNHHNLIIFTGKAQGLGELERLAYATLNKIR